MATSSSWYIEVQATTPLTKGGSGLRIGAGVVRHSAVTVSSPAAMELQAPWTVFVDEAGTDSFRDVRGGERLALIVCAVAVPTPLLKAHAQILPQGASGNLLKSSDREWNRDHASIFVDELLARRVEIAAFMANPGDPHNIELFRENVERANEGRRRFREGLSSEKARREHPDISGHDLHYMRFVTWAIVELAKNVLKRTQSRMTFTDIVLDNKSIAEKQRDWFARQMRRIADENDWTIGRLDWCSEEDEPLLLLPDLVAGIIHREEVHGDVGAAAHKLWDAHRSGRVSFLNKEPDGGHD